MSAKERTRAQKGAKERKRAQKSVSAQKFQTTLETTRFENSRVSGSVQKKNEIPDVPLPLPERQMMGKIIQIRRSLVLSSVDKALLKEKDDSTSSSGSLPKPEFLGICQ